MEISSFIAPNCTGEGKSKTWRLPFGTRRKEGKSRSGSRIFVSLVIFRSARTFWSGLLVDEVGKFLKMLFRPWTLFSRKQSILIQTSTTLVGRIFTQKEQHLTWDSARKYGLAISPASDHTDGRK